MANSFSLRSTVASGRQLLLDSTVPTSLSITTLAVSNDMSCEWEIYIDRNINTLRVPSVSLTDSSSGGSLPANLTVYVRVTCVDADGIESPPSPSGAKRSVGSSGTSKITATWTAQAGAVSYNVYTGTKGGQETLYANVGVATIDITVTPVNQYLSIPTTPDIHLWCVTGALAIPANGISLNQRIVVFATPASGGIVTMSCIAI